MNQGIKPEDVLSEAENYTEINGIRVRKGTIGAALQNAGILSSPNSNQVEKEAAKKVLVELSPALVALGLYEHVIWKNADIQKIMEEAASKIAD